MPTLSFAVPASAHGVRLGVFLRRMGVSASCIKSVKHRGDGFFADGARLCTDQPVQAGQCITFELPLEPSTSVVPQPVPFAVVYDGPFAAVADKPAGVAVHPTLNHTDGTLANGWLHYLRTQGREGVFRPVNRLDKNTSGLVLLAQNAYAVPLLAKSAKKCYLALVQGTLPLGPGCIDAPLGRCGDSIIGRCVRADGKPSLTDYRTLGVGGGHSLVACWPRTGRTHQIRVHMSYIGHPLAGDTLYGGGTDLLDRHALHCAVLAFSEPPGSDFHRFTSPLPPDMDRACLLCGLTGNGTADALIADLEV